MSEAQAQARDAVTRIGKHLLTGEAARFRQLVRVIQRAVQGGQWGRATRGCERARRFCTLFRENPHLRVEERDWLGRAEDNLRVIANYIRTNRTQPGSPTGWLPARHTNLLEAMHVLAVAIRARLRREILEAYHAND